MLDVYKSFLEEIYEHYKSTGNREMQYTFQGIQDKQRFTKCFDYLRECGYVSKVAASSGFFNFKLTIDGIKFIENGYSDPTTPVPVTQGDNSIFIQGSGNSISNNYNQISLDIENSDLPDEYKDLLNNFLYEMQNPKLTPEKKTDKIKQFLTDFSSGTLSGTAATGLTTLLMSLFSKISF
jgi:hypothetical protein